MARNVELVRVIFSYTNLLNMTEQDGKEVSNSLSEIVIHTFSQMKNRLTPHKIFRNANRGAIVHELMLHYLFHTLTEDPIS